MVYKVDEASQFETTKRRAKGIEKKREKQKSSPSLRQPLLLQ